jgi:hypothetical protein
MSRNDNRKAASQQPAAQPSPIVSAAPEKPQRVVYCPQAPEIDPSEPKLKHLGGSKSDEWNTLIANQVSNAGHYRASATDEQRQEQYLAQFAFLAGVNPQNVVEGMIAAQLFAPHAAAMECCRRAMLPNQRQMNLVQAAKLTRANAAQVEALAKHRNKGAGRKSRSSMCTSMRAGRRLSSRTLPGREWQNQKRYNPCYFTCSKRPDAVRKPARARLAGRRQCRTAVAGCTAGRRRARLKAIRTRSSMVGIRGPGSRNGADLRS